LHGLGTIDIILPAPAIEVAVPGEKNVIKGGEVERIKVLYVRQRPGVSRGVGELTSRIN